MSRPGRQTTEIVLVGGGHAHVHVLKAFGERPLAGTRLTLVTRDAMTPYSGMLPGLVAGIYRFEQAHIDLAALAAATGCRLVHGEAIGVDRNRNSVVLANGDVVPYDLLSIDIGIVPDLTSLAGAQEHAIAVKPIAGFLAAFERLRAEARSGGVQNLIVVGGGAAGVELVLSARTRLIADAAATGQDASRFAFTLVTDGEVLATHNARVRATFRRILAERRITLREHHPAIAIGADHVRLADGEELAADATLVATPAAAPAWFVGAGFACDRRGFLAVGPTLQVINDADVFAAGDCASLVETPREKAGVHAVRAGPPLAANLRRHASGQAAIPWRPQARHLSLITTGDRYVIASRGPFKAEGAWLWTLKDWIDRRWMRGYQLRPSDR
jgi:selenide, water dikinase